MFQPKYIGYGLVYSSIAIAIVACGGKGLRLADETKIEKNGPPPILEVLGKNIEKNTLAAGQTHSCIVTNSGKVQCWGYNSLGMLGNGTTINSMVPVDTSPLGAKAIAVYSFRFKTCAILETGEVKCWGSWDSAGLIGVLTPTTITGLEAGATKLSMGYRYACAIQNGGLKCWGQNNNGELGTSNNVDSPTAAVQVVGLESNVTDVSTGVAGTTCAIHQSEVKCWGSNTIGAYGVVAPNSTIPVKVANMPHGATRVAVGNGKFCAIKDGALYCWGVYGGVPATPQNLTPTIVSELATDVTDIKMGNHFCAIQNGAMKCWLSGFYGQLGNGTNANNFTPGPVLNLPGTVTRMAIGEDSTLVLTSSGCYGFGRNSYGQLGDNTTADVNLPILASAVSLQ